MPRFGLRKNKTKSKPLLETGESSNTPDTVRDDETPLPLVPSHTQLLDEPSSGDGATGSLESHLLQPLRRSMSTIAQVCDAKLLKDLSEELQQSMRQLQTQLDAQQLQHTQLCTRVSEIPISVAPADQNPLLKTRLDQVETVLNPLTPRITSVGDMAKKHEQYLYSSPDAGTSNSEAVNLPQKLEEFQRRLAALENPPTRKSCLLFCCWPRQRRELTRGNPSP